MVILSFCHHQLNVPSNGHATPIEIMSFVSEKDKPNAKSLAQVTLGIYRFCHSLHLPIFCEQ